MFMYTDYTQHLLDNVKKIHFIGCGGSGMYPLIQILSAKGYDISGSDVLDGSIIRSEREMGVKVTLGHSADNVVGADLVVYSAAIAKDTCGLDGSLLQHHDGGAQRPAGAMWAVCTSRTLRLGTTARPTTSMVARRWSWQAATSAVIGGKLPLIRLARPARAMTSSSKPAEFSRPSWKAAPILRRAEYRQRPSGLLRQHG